MFCRSVDLRENERVLKFSFNFVFKFFLRKKNLFALRYSLRRYRYCSSFSSLHEGGLRGGKTLWWEELAQVIVEGLPCWVVEVQSASYAFGRKGWGIWTWDDAFDRDTWRGREPSYDASTILQVAGPISATFQTWTWNLEWPSPNIHQHHPSSTSIPSQGALYH
jgi:hypothetical protein